MHYRTLFGSLLLACGLAACRGAGVASAAGDSAAVVAASHDYIDAWVRGDTAAALARVADDVRIFISGVPDVVGKDSARALFAREMATYDVPLLRLDRQELIVRDGYAIDIGLYEEIQMPKRGAPIQGRGRYLTIWRRDGERWRIARYMLNDLPPRR